MKNSKNIEMITLSDFLEEKKTMGEQQLANNSGYPMGRAWYDRLYKLHDEIEKMQLKETK